MDEQSSMSHYKVAEIYNNLRNTVLSVKPEQVGLSEADKDAVLGLLMEIGYEAAVATLALVKDGTVSLYFSNGGGQVGYGEYEPVRKVAAECLALAGQHIGDCVKTDDYPLPASEHVRFYLLTGDGVMTARASGEELGNNRHPLSPLFHSAHKVISAIRMTRAAEESG